MAIESVSAAGGNIEIMFLQQMGDDPFTSTPERTAQIGGVAARIARFISEARATLEGSVLEGNKPNFETYPIASIITYEFPAQGDRPAVKMTWYDGGLMPPTPAEMPRGQRLPDNGVLYVGRHGQRLATS